MRREEKKNKARNHKRMMHSTFTRPIEREKRLCIMTSMFAQQRISHKRGRIIA